MSKTNPKVTVLMPVYNGEKYLNQAIDSILNQTFSDFEFLIIDDGSHLTKDLIIQKVFISQEWTATISVCRKGLKSRLPF